METMEKERIFSMPRILRGFRLLRHVKASSDFGQGEICTVSRRIRVFGSISHYLIYSFFDWERFTVFPCELWRDEIAMGRSMVWLNSGLSPRWTSIS